ncbi:MAG: MFS transporter [Pseudomonadota bacterium]
MPPAYPPLLSTQQQRNYRALVVASALSNLADGLLIVALPWLASELTRDPLLIALVTAATRLPWLLLTLPAGLMSDRMARVPLLRWADRARALLAAVLAVAVFGFESTVPSSVFMAIGLVSVLAFMLGAAEVVRDNTAQTVLPDLVPGAALEQANGRLWSVETASNQLLAPPLAGALIAVALVAPFVVSALGYALASLVLAVIQVEAHRPDVQSGWQAAFLAGWRWLRGHGELLRLALLLGMINFSSTVVLTLMVLYSRELLLLGPTGYGLLLGVAAVGGVAGGVLSPRIVARIGPLPSVWLAFTLFACMPIALWVNRSVVGAAACLFIELFAAMLWNVVTVSWRQRSIPTELLGRVNSLYRCAGWGFMAFGAVCGGALMAGLEPHWGRETALRAPYLVVGLLNIALMVWARRWLRLRPPPVAAA